MFRRHCVWALVPLLWGCGENGGTAQAPSPTGSVFTMTPDVRDAPAGSALEQSPDCLETVVSTVCGRTVRCAKTGEDRLILKDDKRLAPSEDACLRALSDVRRGLLKIESAPFQHGFPPRDPFERGASSACDRPSPAEVHRAAAAVLETVKKEGVARLRALDARQKAYWTTLIRERFEWISVRASCKATAQGPGGQGAFLLEVASDVGAPGSLPYIGLWRVAGRSSLARLAETTDPSPFSSWSAGDLDGDGVEELFLRVQIPDGGGARYELASAAFDQNLVLLARKDEKPEDAALPHPVYSVKLSGKWVVVVGDQTTVYADHALKDAGNEAISERKTQEERARREVKRVLAAFDATVPSFPGARGCEDTARVGWTLAVSRDLVRVGGAPGAGAVATIAEISGLSSCLTGTDVLVSP